MLTRHIYPGPPGITCLVSCAYLEGPGNPTLMRSGLCARILQQQHQLQQQLYHLKVRDIYNDEFHSKNDFRETMLLSGRHWHCFLWSICNECSKTQRYSESLQKSLGHIQQGLNNFVKYCFFKQSTLQNIFAQDETGAYNLLPIKEQCGVKDPYVNQYGEEAGTMREYNYHDTCACVKNPRE